MPFRLKLIVVDLYFFTLPKMSHFCSEILPNLPTVHTGNSLVALLECQKASRIISLETTLGFHIRLLRSDSNIQPENRINYLLHKFIVQYITGANLKPHVERFETNLVRHLQVLSPVSIGEGNDLCTLIRDNLFHASVEAMFGKLIFEVNPNFFNNSGFSKPVCQSWLKVFPAGLSGDITKPETPALQVLQNGKWLWSSDEDTNSIPS
jgi:hypothetical protein